MSCCVNALWHLWWWRRRARGHSLAQPPPFGIWLKTFDNVVSVCVVVRESDTVDLFFGFGLPIKLQKKTNIAAANKLQFMCCNRPLFCTFFSIQTAHFVTRHCSFILFTSLLASLTRARSIFKLLLTVCCVSGVYSVHALPKKKPIYKHNQFVRCVEFDFVDCF